MVGHSLGGILIKQVGYFRNYVEYPLSCLKALINAQNNLKYKEIKQAT